MDKDEALRMALEALEIGKPMFDAYWGGGQFDQAITAIKEALAQPEQEPVAWRWLSSKTWKQWSLSDDKKLVAEAVEWLGEEKVQPLYTTPPQRTWVGLTNEELQPICDEYRIIFGSWAEDFSKAIESKIKEKNNA